MIESNAKRILDMLSPNDVVLDIGGWACPFNRANYILDAQPYETRGYYRTFGGAESQGGKREYFTANTWIQRDICDKAPFPFKDREIDFVICSQTLEDLRDPLWVCSEMIRIAKRGYIEVPSRAKESSRGWEHPNIAGLSHHRWLIEIEGTHIYFLMKYHMINSHWRFSFPHHYVNSLPEEEVELCIFWENSFSFSEREIHGIEPKAIELERFVQNTYPYPEWRVSLDRQMRAISALARRVKGRIARTISL